MSIIIKGSYSTLLPQKQMGARPKASHAPVQDKMFNTSTYINQILTRFSYYGLDPFFTG
jgi:hypothetical protein